MSQDKLRSVHGARELSLSLFLSLVFLLFFLYLSLFLSLCLSLLFFFCCCFLVLPSGLCLCAPAVFCQAHYCLGSTYSLQKNHVKAIEYHEQHLEIATELGDKAGMLRAWYCLRNAHHAVGETVKVVAYHKLIQANQPEGSVPPAVAATKATAGQTPSQSLASGLPLPKQQAIEGISPKPIRKGDKKKPKLFSKKKNTDSVQAFSEGSESDDQDDIVRIRKTGSKACTPFLGPLRFLFFDDAFSFLGGLLFAQMRPRLQLQPGRKKTAPWSGCRPPSLRKATTLLLVGCTGAKDVFATPACSHRLCPTI